MKIAILYYISPGSIKYKKWHDGFTKAIDILRKDDFFQIKMINFFDDSNIELNDFDIVMIKWGFGSTMQNYAQHYFKLKTKKCKIGLFISSIRQPTDHEMKFYDILFYETDWYKNYAKLNNHPHTYHAFGIDTDIMKFQSEQKKYDYIFVGNITEHKRPLNLINKKGKKLVVGFLENKNIINELKKNDIEVLDFVEYSELAKLYNMSNNCYVPCKIDGGGERAVLEARSCGINVEIENDNKKLSELLESDIWDSVYYSNQIKRGLMDLINENIKCDIDLYEFFSRSNLSIVQVGAMDGIKFDKLYPYIKKNNNVKAFLFEPVKYYFDKLVMNYKDSEGHIILINRAISNSDEEISFYIIDPIEIEKYKLPEFLMGISSIYEDRNSLSESYWTSRGKVHTEKYGWTYENIIKKYKKKIKVNSIKPITFLKNYSVNKIDILAIDCEGHDFCIIKDFLQNIKPKYIKFEYNNLPKNELEECKNYLLLNNYKTIFYNSQECLAIFLN